MNRKKCSPIRQMAPLLTALAIVVAATLLVAWQAQSADDAAWRMQWQNTGSTAIYGAGGKYTLDATAGQAGAGTAAGGGFSVSTGFTAGASGRGTDGHGPMRVNLPAVEK